MTTSEVLKLIEAGYTKAEIAALDNPQNPQDNPQGESSTQQPDKQTDQQPDKQTDQQTDKQTDQQTEQQPAGMTAQDFMDWMKKVNESMEKVVRTMQASNLQNDSVDSVGKDMTSNVDKIMQSIIRPEQKEVK